MKTAKPTFSLFLFLTIIFYSGFGQNYTRQDSLRGSITPQRAWWDLVYYHLDISVDISKKTITGKTRIGYRVLKPGSSMQVDLQPPLEITQVYQEGEKLSVVHDGNAHFIAVPSTQTVGSYQEIDVFYTGSPVEAVRPPWEGGITWSEDSNGQPFVASSCQGLGASAWWPCKDHMYDEPDSMLISVTVPPKLMNVSNGRLRAVDHNKDSTKTYHWFVANPINNYGVNVNIGDYAHFSEKYKGLNGQLDMDYYVLRENLEVARKHFRDARRTIEAFEHWFGPYPFYEDSYKLVEAPYMGMEHQSSVTYGNDYLKGYKGRDLSNTGWGMKFDFIIVHESGHEWFANSITYKDMADMWIHESFTSYSEGLFLEYHYGKKAGEEYILGTRSKIANSRPIIGDYEVNQMGSHDMYHKGSNILHTLRQVINDDEKWRTILLELNKKFFHQVVTTNQIEDFLSEKTDRDLKPFFDQYLRDRRVPGLEYYFQDNKLFYRWINAIKGFDMPIRITIGKKDVRINPTTTWNSIDTNATKLVVDRNFYVTASRLF